ncbi:hypothetical protein KIW84_066316 [Lathyrus oleraceus]|uniref:DNA topoisomerase (ATP-hydrolyzing) n=1 Tax=Pisum sativum TaxID=3888 RepID=A0A9D5ABE8_PEA|nr:hypothetical protein KIW84_066316 [Pisum sativum]
MSHRQPHHRPSYTAVTFSDSPSSAQNLQVRCHLLLFYPRRSLFLHRHSSSPLTNATNTPSVRESVRRSAHTTVPGLFKIFYEILVNAPENKGRDPSMDSLKVTMDPEANAVSAYNNSDGVPVEIRQEKEDDEGEQAQRRRNTGNLCWCFTCFNTFDLFVAVVLGYCCRSAIEFSINVAKFIHITLK